MVIEAKYDLVLPFHNNLGEVHTSEGLSFINTKEKKLMVMNY